MSQATRTVRTSHLQRSLSRWHDHDNRHRSDWAWLIVAVTLLVVSKYSDSANAFPVLNRNNAVAAASGSPILSTSTCPIYQSYDHSSRSSSTIITTTSVYASKSSSSSSTTTTTTIPKTKKKKVVTTKKKKKSNTSTSCDRPIGPGRTLSEEELNQHVSARYRTSQLGSFTDTTTPSFDDPEKRQFFKELNNRPALVLNADYQPLSYLPLSLWSWQDSVKSVFLGKVSVVDVYPDICVRAANIEVPLPSVIALSDYVAHQHKRPAFTRRNVFLRDAYQCQYCNNRFHTADLSLDHVVPRSRGGVLSWDNAVTSCLTCNGKKGSKTLDEIKGIGMKLKQMPKCPSQMELAARAAKMVPKRVHPTWKPYLGIAKRPSTSSNGKGGDEDYIDDRYFEIEV